MPATPRTTSVHQRLPVTIKIDVPKATSSTAARRAAYVSPATTQMTIDIQTGCPGACTDVSGYPTTVALTPTSGGCTSTLASTSCQLQIALPPGNYTMTLTTADSGGTTLSTAQQIAFTIAEGQANTVSLSLSGVPASIIASVLNQNAAAVLVEALDADGNIIVGPGAPTFTVAQTAGPTAWLVQPTTTSPNEFLATPSAPGTATLQVTASYSGTNVTNACTQSGAVCTATFAYTATQASQNLFVPNESGNDVTIYGAPFTGAPTTTISVNAAYAVALDSKGDLFVSSFASGSGGVVTEYAPPYSTATATIASIGYGFPTGLAVGADGTLYIASDFNGTISSVAPPYTGTPQTVISGLNNPNGIIFDASGNLWIADTDGQDVREYPPPYTNGFTSISPGGYPSDVGFDTNKNLFVLAYANSTPEALEYAPPYTGAPTATITGGGVSQAGLALDPANNLYIADQDITDESFKILTPPSYTSGTQDTSGLYGPGLLRMFTSVTVSISPS
ncbi:MAG TPA: hypothetical protein VMD91_19015 [Candidatus Sulfotelmatobacter sp.]|nr:hypothetical protein [Candidatus Sulfotelmatobacter sp.]